MLDEFVSSTNVPQTSEANLCDDSTEFAGSSRDTMACWTIASREDFSGDDEGGGVGTKILEEVGQAVEEHKSLLGGWCRGELVVSET